MSEPIRVLDLFAGLQGWATPWRERGHEVLALDYDWQFAQPDLLTGTAPVDIIADILTWDPSTLPWRPDVVLASPPCEGFTVMNIGRNWTHEHEPKTETARLGLAILKRTREVIAELRPSFFVIENPVAKMRRMPVMADLERRTVWYCHYGDTSAKPTDLWGGFPPSFTARPPCHQQSVSHTDACCCRDHVSAPRGSRTEGSIQGKGSAEVRALVPQELSLAVCIAAESDLAIVP